MFDGDCFPSHKPVSVRVIFALENQKPHVSLVVATVDVPPDNSMKAVKRKKVSYPRAPLRDGVQAYVYSGSVVNPDGSVANVETEVHPGMAAVLADSFSQEVQASLGAWTYTPLPPGQSRRRLACQEVFFQLR